MNFSQFVIRNTLRNKHLYLAYFLSTLFSVMVFFTFSVFAFHPALTEGLNSKVQTGMLAAAIIIYGFAFFFVLYSMSVFLQSRKKEFGLLMIQGMSPKQLRKMVFIENLVIGFFATIFGCLSGVLFSQGILVLADKLMRVRFSFYFPSAAIMLTCLSFAVLFLLISVMIQFRLPKLNVQSLLKANELGKGDIKVSWLKSFLALVLLAAGYIVALITPGMAIIVVFLPVVFVVIVGTNFFFDQLSVFVIEKLKQRKRIFWKKTNMVVLSDLSFRMKDNARSFFLVSIISTVAFAAIGTLYCVQDLIVGSLKSVPYQFEVLGDSQEDKKMLNQTLQELNIGADEINYTYYVQNDQQVISVDDYNRVAKAFDQDTIKLGNNAVQLKSSSTTQPVVTATEMTVNGQKLPVNNVIESTIISAFVPTFVVPNETNFAQYESNVVSIWKTTSGTREAQIQAGEKLAENHSIIAMEYMKDSMIQGYAPVLFVGIFIGIVFFISAGSFLYFRLYSDFDNDCEKFKMIYKVGLSKKELRKMISQQVAILFFTPIIVSVVHGAVALTAMYHMFDLSLQMAAVQVLGIFVAIQLAYYLVARAVYFKKVYKVIT